MKKKVLVDLIKAHYEGDNNLFFRTALEVLKELKDNGDVELAKYIETNMRYNLTIVPAPVKDTSKHEMYPEEAAKYFDTWQVTD